MGNKIIQENELRLYASRIAHDMKTPLVAIRSSLNCMKEVFQELIESYQLAVNKKIIEDKLDMKFLNKISSSLDNSIKETESLNNLANKLRDVMTGDG